MADQLSLYLILILFICKVTEKKENLQGFYI